MRIIPSIKSVIAFEAVARQGSVKAAAEELCVSQSAISHHLSNLEKELHVRLFHRKNKLLLLTDVGRHYVKQLSPALEIIANASAEAISLVGKEKLTISAPPTLISNWLIPRLKPFLYKNKHLSIIFIDRMEFDPTDKDLDCAIEYRFQQSKDYISTLLIPDEWVPLASLGFIKNNPINSLDDLKGITLIETKRRLVSWQIILSDYAWIKHQRILSFPFSTHAFMAAENGLGVALGNFYNAYDLVNEGKLCVPFVIDPKIIPATPKYFLTISQGKINLPKVEIFSKWIKDEVFNCTSAEYWKKIPKEQKISSFD